MDFTRKKVKGKLKQNWKEGYDSTGQYRITWRNEVFGIAVDPAYYACVWCKAGGYDADGHIWNFAAHRRPYKTFKAAVEACELNQRLWNKFIDLGRAPGRRAEPLKELRLRSVVGNKPTAGVILASCPVWVIKDADRKLLEMLFPRPKQKFDEDDECEDSSPDTAVPNSTTHSEPWKPSEPVSSPVQSDFSTKTDGPASPVMAEAEPSTPVAKRPKARTSSKRAKPVPAAEPAPKRRSKSSTTRTAKTTKKTRPATTAT